MSDAELWREAQERVLLYLKRMGMPAMDSLDIARQALAAAVEEAPARVAVPPLERAMRAMHDILGRDRDYLLKTPYARFPELYLRWQGEDPPAAGAEKVEGADNRHVAAWPPINRASMTIKKL